jgi:hypothetical protein
MNKDKIIKIISSKWFIFALIVLLIWRIFKNNIILIFGIGAIWYLYHREATIDKLRDNEHFNSRGREFVSIGDYRYDLRGLQLSTRRTRD